MVLGEKNDNTPVFIAAAKQCCTEPEPFSVKGPGSWEGAKGPGSWEGAKGYSIPSGMMQKEF